MTARDRFVAPLKCPICGLGGTAELSQEDGWSFLNGNRSTRVDELPDGFREVSGNCFYASDIDIVCKADGVSAVQRPTTRG